MSECPGDTLEEWVANNWGIVVDTGDGHELDPSWGNRLAEMLGNIKPRTRFTQKEFDGLISIYEPHREYIEYKLGEFDESTSWRGYNSTVDWCPDEVNKAAQVYVQEIEKKKGKS